MPLNPVDFPTEHQEQVKLVKDLALYHPLLIFLAIPNGGLRDKVTAKLLQAEGVKPGVPDLFFPALLLWIEMKRQKGGALRDAQKRWRDDLRQIGYQVEVCNSAASALAVVDVAVARRGIKTHNFPEEFTNLERSKSS